MGRLVALNPTSFPNPLPADLARPLDRLAGRAVGFMSNNKTNADALLGRLADRLAERFDVRPLHFNKGNPAQAAPREMIEECARACDAVVFAIHD